MDDHNNNVSLELLLTAEDGQQDPKLIIVLNLLGHPLQFTRNCMKFCSRTNPKYATKLTAPKKQFSRRKKRGVKVNLIQKLL